MKALSAGTLAGILLSCSTDGIAPGPSNIDVTSGLGKEEAKAAMYARTPPLTPLGFSLQQQPSFERRRVADRLLQGFENINAYTNGICYEAVAFVRFLYDNAITCDDLSTYYGGLWVQRFNFPQGRQWDGNFALAGGEIIGFRDETDRAFFHAAIAIGEYDRVRSVNGGRLGAGWLPVSLKTILGPRNYDGTFNYDGRKIRVFISPL